MDNRTIYQMLLDTTGAHGVRPAISGRQGNSYCTLTYSELLARVRALRRGMLDLGLQRGDKVAILSYNRPEWAIIDLAAQAAGLVTVPIYHTLPAPQVEHIVRDSGARMLFVEDQKQAAKAAEFREQATALNTVVQITGDPQPNTISFAELEARAPADAKSDDALDAIAMGIGCDDTATLIYTSGTTGAPKGAVLSHRALLHTAWAARQIITLDHTEVFLSFLPLCHIIERVGGHYLPLSIGAQIFYSEGPMRIAKEIAEVRPTLFLCVPRLFEAMIEKVRDDMEKLTGMKRKLVDWAMAVGRSGADSRSAGRGVGLIHSALHSVADRLVLKKIRDRVTGGRLRYFIAGGAPLAPETALSFDALGVTILEGYGLTELPVISITRPNNRRLGTVGEALPEIEIKIAPDGEILARGPSLMRGYYGLEEATTEAIDREGWFHTGDVGELDARANLKITDRKKDIIVLANGKNVAPQPIEALLKRSPYVADAVLLGDKQNGIVALIAPSFDRLKTWARDENPSLTDAADLCKDPSVRRLIKQEIDSLSGGLADFERVKRFVLVEQPFTVETGELTPTLKVKRRFIAEKYADKIAELRG